MASRWRICLTMFYVIVLCILANTQSKQITTESVLLNVTAVSESSQTEYSVQINLNIGFLDNETFVNGAPLKSSGVTRMRCPALLLDGGNVSSGHPVDGSVICELRLMLNQSFLQNDAGEQVLLLLSQEIIQLADEKVQQPDVCEVEIRWNQSAETITQITNVYPSSRSKLSAVPRESDVLVTDASVQNTVEDQVRNTTSHYLLKHAETTQEEIAAPGKLPETPLRMDPETLYGSREEDERASDSVLLGVPLSGSISSYSVACQWVEELRDKLRRFWSDSVPLFFLIMWVVVVGIAGSAVIIKILDLLFPSCEHGGFFHLNPETLMPEDEKQRLIDDTEGDMPEKSILIEK